MNTIKPNFAEGQPMSAARWNEIARAVNRLWASRAQMPLKLTKGDRWALSVDPAYLAGLNGAPAGAEGLTFIELPACIDDVPSTVWIPAIIPA